MAKTHEYKVTLNPCEIKDGMVSFLLYDPRAKTYTVTADSLAKMQGDIRALVVHDFRMNAAVWCQLADRNARKPNGFDAAVSAIRTIPYVAPVEPESSLAAAAD